MHPVRQKVFTMQRSVDFRGDDADSSGVSHLINVPNRSDIPCAETFERPSPARLSS